MRTKLFLGLCVLSIAAWLHSASNTSLAEDQKEPSKSIAGLWQGDLKIGVIDLRITVKVSKEEDDSLTARLDSPDENQMDLKLTDVTFKDGAFHFVVKVSQIVYDGKINKEGTQIAGEMKQAGRKFSLVLKRTDNVAGLNRRQLPKKPYPYDEEEVIYDSKNAGNKLAGSLTLPESGGPFPVVLLISGTGPDDRDETLVGHKPFLVIADYLTLCGIAVLRVDDWGVGKSTGSFAGATTEDFADDVECGVEFLKTRKDIDPQRIGLMGHSEGGTIAPMVAAKSKDIAFIVLLAGTGLPGDEFFYLQDLAIAKATGAPEERLRQLRLIQDKLYAVLKAEKDVAVAEKKLIQALKELAEQLPESERKQYAQNLMETQAKILLEPWKRFFILYDPRPALRKAQCPVLAINGERDVQVTYKENLAEIEKALMEGGNKDYTVKTLPGLNHRFQTCKHAADGGYLKAIGEYGKFEETFAPAALAIIGD